MTNFFKNNLKSIAKEIRQVSRTKKYETGIALSGGAAHGFAHLGVLKALRELKNEPDIISGASAGSIVGAFYADGFEPEEILEIFKKNKLFDFVGIKLQKQALFNISGLQKTLKNNLKTKFIEDLQKPLIVATTNVSNASTEYFYKGKLTDAVIASSSIPVIFNPFKINKSYYIDGGVTDNFPIAPLDGLCQKTIGVNVNPLGGFKPAETSLVQFAIHVFHLSVSSGILEKKKEVTYYIEPEKLANYSYVDLNKGTEMMEIGYEETMKVMHSE